MRRIRELVSGRLARAISVPTVILYLFTLVVGVAMLVASPLGAELSNLRTTQHLEFFFVFFNIPMTLDMLTTTSMALLTYVLCLLAAGIDKGGYVPGVKGKVRPTVPNWLIVIPLVSSALLIIVVLTISIQEFLGLPTGNLPSRPVQILLAELTTAPISEEIGFRITPIGTLVISRIMITRWTHKISGRQILLSMLAPDSAKSESGLESVSRMGLRGGIHWSEWIMVATSAIIFGIAHATSPGSNWEVGKITTAALSGFVIGLAYLIYGAYAAITLHWFFDYYLQVSLIGSMLIHSPYEFQLLLTGLDTIIAYWTTIVGIVVLLLVPLLLIQANVIDRSDSSL